MHVQWSPGLRQSLLWRRNKTSEKWLRALNAIRGRWHTRFECRHRRWERSYSHFVICGRDHRDFGTAESTIQSCKADAKGVLKKGITCEHTFQSVHNIQYQSPLYFCRAGNSGAAVFDSFGMFIGLYFAGNDYTFASYFAAAKDLSSEIKRLRVATQPGCRNLKGSFILRMPLVVGTLEVR